MENRTNSQMIFAPAGQATSGNVLVYISLLGGADGLNMVVPVGDRNYPAYRPTIKILEPSLHDPRSGINLDGYFALHPTLAPLERFYQDNKLAIVHAVGLPDLTHSHYVAMDNLARGSMNDRSITTGWLGRHLVSKTPEKLTPLRALGFGPTLPGVMRGFESAVTLQSIGNFSMTGRLQDQADYLNHLQLLYQMGGNSFGLPQAAVEVQPVLGALNKLKSLDFVSSNYLSYPQSRFGQMLLDTIQIINADIGLEVACLEMDGWDMHSDEGSINGGLNRQLLDLIQGLTAFATDLGDRLKNVLVMTVSEFGRRVRENGSHGTDHGHGNAMFLLGGGVAGGKVFGTWPTLAPDKLTATGDLAVTTDYRDVFSEVLQVHLGNPNLAAVFPDYTPKPVGIFKPK
jgi:uncharacterized protein (DUF1501 family)